MLIFDDQVLGFLDFKNDEKKYDNKFSTKE